MGCIEKIYSVSAVLGGPACNANCPGCAGKVLRNDVRKHEDCYNKAPRNIVAASRLALNYGAWTLSLTTIKKASPFRARFMKKHFTPS